MNKIYVFFLAGIFLACNSKTIKTQENIVAKVHDYVLTEDELKQNLPTTNSKVDSLNAIKAYVNEWARQKLLYRNALVNLDNTEELDKMVDKYREELYVAYYKNAIVNKKLDTLVYRKEIDSFYTANKSSFELNEVLLKFKYIHLEPGSKNRSQVRKLFLSNDAGDKQKLLEEHIGYDDYYFNDSVWVSLKDIYNKKASFPVFNNYQLSKKERFVQINSADRSIYYFYIKDVLREGDKAPIEYVEPTIKNILLHKNKMKFFSQMEQILIDDAVKQKKYEVY